MKRYAILRHEANESNKSGPRAGPFGRPRAGPFAASAGPPVFSVERLPDKAIAELARDPQTEAVTPVMPPRLIEPLGGEAVEAGDNWGVAAVGADQSPFSGA